MSSGPPTERSWSLTRRMALLFAVTTSVLVLAHGLWSGYLLVDTLRGDMRAFLDHEVEELGLMLAQTNRSRDAVQRCAENIARVTGTPATAFRVRGPGGGLLASAGPPDLLARHPEPLPIEVGWRDYLFSRKTAVAHRRVRGEPFSVEVISDAGTVVAGIRRGLLSVGLAVLGGIVLAGVAGGLTAFFGLRGLREVVRRAHVADATEPAPPMELRAAPREIRQVGQALDQMLSRIRRGLVDIRNFTAGLAHELRSPIQNLLGETEVALLSDRAPEEYREVLRSNLEDIHALADAVDNLVAWCRTSEPGRRDLHAETFDLAAEAAIRLNREKRAAERAGVRVDVSNRGETVLRADREGCLRVLRNLVGNAVVWSPPGGAVDVLVEGDERAVRVVVEDRGPGVPADLRDRIFEPFVTGQKRAGKRGGYGLGLAICRSVVEEHGGRLAHEDREGGGSRFVAEFPRGAGDRDAVSRGPESGHKS